MVGPPPLLTFFFRQHFGFGPVLGENIGPYSAGLLQNVVQKGVPGHLNAFKILQKSQILKDFSVH